MTVAEILPGEGWYTEILAPIPPRGLWVSAVATNRPDDSNP